MKKLLTDLKEEDMKQVLMLASVASMIDQFNMPNIALLQKLGYHVDVACNFEQGNTCSDARVAELKSKLREMNVRCYQIDFARNIKCIGQNIKAYQQVKKLMEQNHYVFCHCHSPIGGVVARIAGHRTKTKVIYTAHGFHFYQGAPVMNWLVYYPVEKMLSRWTDVLITINQEDYKRAESKFRMKKLVYVPGVGVDVTNDKLTKLQKEKKRTELGIPQEAFWILNVAEFTLNKNQITEIKAINNLNDSNVYLTMCGIGTKKEELEEYVQQHNLGKRVKFLGFRSDIQELMESSDCFMLSSFREGLSVALMESMAAGCPVICSKIRGNVDLIDDGIGGTLVKPESVDEHVKAIEYMKTMKENNYEKYLSMGLVNKRKIEKFSAGNVKKIMVVVYGSM